MCVRSCCTCFGRSIVSFAVLFQLLFGAALIVFGTLGAKWGDENAGSDFWASVVHVLPQATFVSCIAAGAVVLLFSLFAFFSCCSRKKGVTMVFIVTTCILGMALTALGAAIVIGARWFESADPLAAEICKLDGSFLSKYYSTSLSVFRKTCSASSSTNSEAPQTAETEIPAETASEMLPPVGASESIGASSVRDCGEPFVTAVSQQMSVGAGKVRRFVSFFAAAENEFNCGGACEPGPPIFSKGDKGSASTACIDEMASFAQRFGIYVGIPLIVIGALLFLSTCVGCCWMRTTPSGHVKRNASEKGGRHEAWGLEEGGGRKVKYADGGNEAVRYY
uniref:Tetraspanin n=1 Tax=Chromera velia CCMP2878 TaxID=1169474 RepID=A0A0G4I330_9ALVE|eukprot:Cvel_1731.t1-p1 / transcript=Cvel_1731.t1 / gene=Cvel_1731 / organism=Chromera_velia_CCMP2878 / gene_product=hypothetical protein / transcript_product=hypothetical protein / location=Cvel_scaffold63:23610-25112(+) / protein_length=335 / sequence_SO=supercontig / SO=protein_coding / is_pseudo=false